MSGATTGKVGINTTGLRLLQNQRVGKFIPSMKYLNNGFLYHYLLTQEKLIYRIAGGGAQPNLSSNKLMCLSIPVPPIEVQEEIVRVLDSFAKLEAELEAELEARRRQYAYYRDQLIHSCQKERKVSFSELHTFTGKTPSRNNKKYFGNKYAFFKPGDFNSFESVAETEIGLSEEGFNSLKQILPGSTLVVCIGATIGKVGYALKEGSCNQQINVILPNKILNKRFVFHYMCSFFGQDQIKRLGNFSSMPILNLKSFNQIEIPVPPLSEQQHIVDILEKFDALVNDISQGLPAEIEARRKQYEYYRDKLLTFKKKED